MKTTTKEYKTNIPKFSLIREKTDFKKIKITKSSDAANYAYSFYENDIDIIESFFVLMLNNANNTIGYVKISQGGIAGTLVDALVIAKYVVQSMAKSVILVHNHPSGKLEPSPADKEITQKIKKGLQFLDVRVLDHIILTPKDDESLKYFSFGDEGII
mgnify:FL=1